MGWDRERLAFYEIVEKVKHFRAEDQGEKDASNFRE
jgi:hypothetical protein